MIRPWKISIFLEFSVVLQAYSFVCHLIQVAQLRQRFFHSISPGGLAGDRSGVVPASGFSFSAQQIWKVIKENKDLDLPAHKVMYFLLLSLSLSLYVRVCMCVCACAGAHVRVRVINSSNFICIYLFVYQIMVATVRCEEIANEKLSRLISDEVLICAPSIPKFLLDKQRNNIPYQSVLNLIQGWLELEYAVQAGPVLGFGEKLSSVLEMYFSE